MAVQTVPLWGYSSAKKLDGISVDSYVCDMIKIWAPLSAVHNKLN